MMINLFYSHYLHLWPPEAVLHVLGKLIGNCVCSLRFVIHLHCSSKTSRDCYPDFILTSSLQIDGNISSVFSCDIAITSLTIIIVMLNLFILFRTCRTLRLIFPRQILDGLPSIYQHHFILSVCLLVSVLLRDESVEESQHRRR